MRRFFIEHPKGTEACGSTQVITGSDARHIKQVLRLKPGDKIGLFDGTGLEYEAKIVNLFHSQVEVSVVRISHSATESPVQIIVAQALLKGRKMDGLVRQLTELGITRWIPFMAKRSVPSPSQESLLARSERWKKIAKEALKQCQRSQIMKIGATISFEEALNLENECDLKVVFWENESKSINSTIVQPDRHYRKIYAMLGPEGGFTEQEIKSARDSGFVIASLGPRILRAETATVVACALLQYLFGDIRQKNLDKDMSF